MKNLSKKELTLLIVGIFILVTAVSILFSNSEPSYQEKLIYAAQLQSQITATSNEWDEHEAAQWRLHDSNELTRQELEKTQAEIVTDTPTLKGLFQSNR